MLSGWQASGDQVGQGGDDATDFRDLSQTGKDSVFIFYIFDSLVIPKFFQVLNKCCKKKTLFQAFMIPLPWS